MRVARVFVPPVSPGTALVAEATAACRDALAAGMLVVLSVKLDPAQVMMGVWDSQLRDLAVWAAWTGPKVALVYWHEPEDDHDALAWGSAFTRVRQVVTDAADGVPVGYVAMAYQWEPGRPATVDGDAWWVDADFYGLDLYSGPDPAPYWRHEGGNRWWEYIGHRAVAAKRWWMLSERGFRGGDDADCAAVIDAEADHIAKAPQPPVAYVLWASPAGKVTRTWCRDR